MCGEEGMTRVPSEKWLEALNAQMAKDGTAHRGRPWRAWLLWAQETGAPLDLEHPDVRRIFEWFAANTKTSSQLLGPMYLGAFYYDAEFWPLRVPIVFGTVRLDLVELLSSMPRAVVSRMTTDPAAVAMLMNVFADSVDVAFHFDDAQRSACYSEFGRSLMKSAYNTLRGVAPLLLMSVPSPNAIQASRFAAEIFLKAFLAAKDGLTETTAKKLYGHCLDRLAARCLEIAPNSDFGQVLSQVGVFPPVEERYQSIEWKGANLWDAYATALLTAATVVRILTGQDSRPAFASVS